MVVKLLEIKNHSYYFWNDIIHLKDFDVNLIKIVKRESRINVDIYYIEYIVKKPQHNIDSVNPLYLIIRHLFGRIEKIERSSDRYLVIDQTNKKLLGIFHKLFSFIKDKIDKIIKNSDKITFGNIDNKITEYNKLRFSSDVDFPLDTLIEFHAITIYIGCIIEKGNKYYPEIHIDDCLYESNIV